VCSSDLVRLKRVGADGGKKVGQRFNPTRVRLKPHSHLSPSTPWALQPHKGSSETDSGPRSAFEPGRLQPHKGSSETPSRHAVASMVWPLQPHKGSSETDIARAIGC